MNESPTLLVTGFEPFTTGQGLVLDHNPTADIAARVAAQVAGAESRTLPVSFVQTKATLLAHFESLRPKHWLGMGYAPHRTTLDIETFAVNMEHAKSGDNDGEKPFLRPIVEGAPPAYETRMDIPAAIALFARHGVEAVPCFHAGTFLCNQTFFLGCHGAETTDYMESGTFIHVPPMDSYDAFEKGLVDVLTTLCS